MKIIVTHKSPDLDAITSVWLIKRFLTGWEDANLEFVPSGERLEQLNDNEVVHVDTGLGSLDHHSTSDENISAASLTWDYIKSQTEQKTQNKESERTKDKEKAIDRMVEVVTDIDHFKEVYWDNSLAYYHDFQLFSILEGLKFEKPNNDLFYAEFVMQCLDAVLHSFENRLWAEKEIAQKGIEFETKWGKSLGIESVNDAVIKLGQKMAYAVVVRRDPRKGYVRIKGRPDQKRGDRSIDLTLVCEKLRKMDPEATWYLHVSKKMLLNGTAKNPKMRPTTLSLKEIISVLEKV